MAMRRSNWIRRRRPDCRPLPLILTNYLRKRDVEAGWICLHAAKRRNGGLIDAARFMSCELKGWIVACGCLRFAWSGREARPLTWQKDQEALGSLPAVLATRHQLSDNAARPHK